MELYNFEHSEAQLGEIANDALKTAKAKGADSAEVSLGESFALAVEVRVSELENCEFGLDCDLSITVHHQDRTGNASCSALTSDCINRTIERALAMAKHAQPDECAGLADPEMLASGPVPDLKLYHPWRPTIEQLTELALECEAASFIDKRISQKKSEGAGISCEESRWVYANSHGFIHAVTTTANSISCSVLAEVSSGMVTGYWGDSKRDYRELLHAKEIGRKAGERALMRDGIRPIKTSRVPAIFETGCAHSLIGNIIGGASGGNIYRKLSYMAGKIGSQVCTDKITLLEDPTIPAGKRSRYCDSDGVQVHKREIVSDGILNGYLLSCYSARKLGMQTTGNASGAHNTEVVCKNNMSLEQMLKQMDTGLFITETMGQDANLVTGDFSCGASGCWVEKGQIIHPVDEITVAGTLPEILGGIEAAADDHRELGGMKCSSLLVNQIALGARN